MQQYPSIAALGYESFSLRFDTIFYDTGESMALVFALLPRYPFLISSYCDQGVSSLQPSEHFGLYLYQIQGRFLITGVWLAVQSCMLLLSGLNAA